MTPKAASLSDVSNQSFAIDPVDIKISIDATPVVDQDFYVKNQHNWKEFRLSLPAGTHTLRVHSSKGNARLEKTLDVKGKHWAVVDFWYYPKTHYDPTPRHFTFDLKDKPIYFE